MDKGKNLNQKKLILVVEDDKFIARAYKDGLERFGYMVEAAYDGYEALDKIKLTTPDLVLLDLIIPGLDGFGVLEQIRKMQEMKDVPVLVLSNLSQDSDVHKAKDLGATDYMTKATFSMKEVLEKVKGYLDSQ